MQLKETITGLIECKKVAEELLENYSLEVIWNESHKNFLIDHKDVLESNYVLKPVILKATRMSILEVSVLRRHLKFYLKYNERPYQPKKLKNISLR